MRYFSLRRLLTLSTLIVCAFSLLVVRAAYTRGGNVSRSVSLTSPTTTASQRSPSAKQVGPRIAYLPQAQPLASEWLHAFNVAPSAAFFAPAVTAIKSATLAAGGDVNGNTFINPGDTLTYSVTISNSGMDATGLSFSDTLDANLTLVGGSVMASPVAVNDSYPCTGNLSISIPAGSGVLANDYMGFNPLATITASSMTSANGGTVAVMSDGSFTYEPAAGFTGTDAFTYTLMNSTGSSVGTVSITVTNRIWFINNTGGACASSCNGRFSHPFTSLSAFISAAVDASGDRIFIYQGASSYAGALTLETNERLIGQGDALDATTLGFTPAANGPTLPSATAKPTLTNTLTLANGVTVLAISMSTGASTGITGSGGLTGLTVGDSPTTATNGITVTTTTGTTVSLNNVGGNFTFRSLSANGATTGLALTSTPASLNFTVTGDNNGLANGSGGTIQNITGGLLGNAPAYFLTASGVVTLKSMNMAITVNAFSGMHVDNNAGGTITVNVTGCTFTGVQAGNSVQNKALLQFEGGNTGGGAANITANVQNSFFFDNRTYGVAAIAAGDSMMNVTLNQSGFGTEVNTGAPVNQPGTTITNPPPFSALVSNSSNAKVDYSITNNTFWGADGLKGALYAVTISGATNVASSHLNGTISGNKIGKTGVVGSGCSTNCAGIGLLPGTGGTFNATVTNNDIRQVSAFGVNFVNSVTGANGTSIGRITNNTIAEPDITGSPTFIRGIVVADGNSGGSTANWCAEVTGNNISGSWQAGFFIRITSNNTTGILTLPGLTPATGASAAQVNSYIQGLNTLPANSVGTTVGTGPINGGAACALPSAPPPIDTDEQLQLKQQGGNNSASIAQGWQQWLHPVFTAFAAPTSVFKISSPTNWIIPTAMAAENSSVSVPSTEVSRKRLPTNTPQRGGTLNARTSSNANAALSGETVSVTGITTLPVGKSVIIKFNATIAAGFTGTAITNQATVAGSNFSMTTSNNLSTPVIQAPSINKTFSPTSIALSGTNLTTSTLTLVLTNPNPSQALSAIAFTDNLTGGLQVDTTPTLSNGCGGTFSAPLAGGQTALSYSGGSIPAGVNCTISFKVRSTSVGAKTNATSGVTSTQANLGAVSNTATLNVLTAPTLAKPFGAASVALNGTTSLTFNITNNDATFGLTGVGFTDTLPTGLTVAATPNVTGSCGGGTITAAANSGTISLSGASLAASGTCSLSVDVTGTTAGAKNNSVALAANETGTNSTPATSTLNVFAPPTFSKNFVASPIVVGQTAALNILITNPMANPANLTGIALTDTLPAGITTADLAATPQCGGTLTISSNVITLTGGSIAPDTTCTITRTVIGVQAQVAAWTNTIGSVSSTNGGTNSTPATANITVNKASTVASITGDTPDPSVTGQPYTVTAGISVSAPGAATPTVPTGTITVSDGSQTCTITLPATTCMLTSTTAGAKTLTATYNGDTNFNASPASAGVVHTVNKANTTTTITADTPDPSNPGASVAVSFTVVANSPGAGTPTGNVTVSDGVDSCTGTVAAGTCNITLNTPGLRTLTATYAGDTNFNGSSDTELHQVATPPTVAKSFLPTQIKVNETSVMTFTVANPNAGLALSNISFSDTFPAGVEVDNPVVMTNTCGGSFSPALVGGATSFSYIGGSIGAGGPVCTISVQVKATTAGVKPNTTGVISATETGAGATSNTATLTVVGAPVLAKAFTPPTVVFGQTSSLGFTITNNNTTVALTGIAFSDTLPAGVTVANSGPTATCGGTLTTTAPNTVGFSGGTLAVGSPVPTTCTFSVTVATTAVGALLNTTGAITSVESGAGATALATLTVNKANTTTTITNAATLTGTPTVVGQPYTVSVSVAPVAPGSGVPTGMVNVSDGTGGTCVVTLSGGVGSCSLTSTTFGAKTITATYVMDSNFNGSVSAGAAHTVNKADTTTTITNAVALATATVVGQSYAVTWNVAVNAPGAIGAALTGNVTVDAGGGNTCTATVSAGTCNIISTTAGVKSITATYAGDTNYNGSASSGVSHTVNKADTTTTITNAASLGSTPTVVGESYAVNWSVTVNAPGAVGAALTGNVTVSDGTASCTAAVSAGTCSLISTSVGAKTITATYAGDTNYNGSTSAGASHTVNKPNTTTTITNAASLSSTPTVVGQSYAVNWSVTVNAPGTLGVALSGNVTVSDGSQSCTAAVSAGTCNLTSTTAGAKTITATYAGDANYNGSTAAGAAHTVNKANTSLSALADTPDPTVVGEAYTVGFTLNVTAPGAGTPTGTVTVSDGTGGVCTATLPATSCSLTSTTAGAKTVTFTYNGDANFNTSNNTTGHQVNKGNTTTTITADTPDPSVAGQAYAVTVALAVNAPAVGTPMGMITVSDGSQSCTITLPGTSCNLTSTTAGAKTLTATYNGDANFNTSVSAGATHQVNCPTIDLLPKPSGPVMNPAYNLPTTTVGANYTATNTVITPTPAGGNYSFTVIAAPALLPPGLSLSPTANNVQIVGTPTAAGTYVFRIRATGFGTCVGSRLYAIKVNTAFAPTVAAKAVRNDFDGDGKSDPARWLAEEGEWQVVFSSDSEVHRIALTEPQTSGEKQEEYLPAAADFDGDLRTDAAVWRPRDGRWLIKRSTDGELMKEQFGLAGDTPLPADFDGDGRADAAVWRNGADGWHILRSSDQTVQAIYLGEAGDVPVLGDYDGDGLTDVAMFRASDGRWLLRATATGAIRDERFGRWGDVPLLSDHDGDGRDDLLVWRAAEGVAYVRRSLDEEVQRLPWGQLKQGEAAVLGDYDGDGKAEPAIWRGVKAVWDILFNH